MLPNVSYALKFWAGPSEKRVFPNIFTLFAIDSRILTAFAGK